VARRPHLFAVALCACGPLARPAPGGAPAPAPESSTDGEIVERAPCPFPGDVAAFTAEVEDYLTEDLTLAGLDAELAARPIVTLFPPSDHARLVDAAGAGRCERVVYRSGELRVVGFVLRPPGPAPRDGHPVILWLRGGNREFGRIGPYHLAQMLDLADAGFVIVATQYRGVDGGDGADELAGRDVADVHALVPLARGLPDVDATRLFLLGNSRGAISGLVAMRQGLPVRAAAFRGGVYDLERAVRERPDLEPVYGELIPEWTSDRAGALRRRSAIRWLGSLHAPILLLHGRQDWRVSLDSALAFHLALDQTDLEHALVIYERDEHQLAFHRRAWLAEATSWFRRHGAFAGAPTPPAPAGATTPAPPTR